MATTKTELNILSAVKKGDLKKVKQLESMTNKKIIIYKIAIVSAA